MEILDRDPRNPSQGGSDFTPIRRGAQLPPFSQKNGSNTLFTDPPMGPNVDRRGQHRNRVRLSKRARLESARAIHGLHDSPEVIHARAVLEANSALSKQDEQRILIQIEEEKRAAVVQSVRAAMGQNVQEAARMAETREIARIQRSIEHAGGDPSAMEAYGFKAPEAPQGVQGLRNPMARPGQRVNYALPPSGVPDDTQNPAYGGAEQTHQANPWLGAPVMDESQLSPEELAASVAAQAAQEAQATQAGMNPGLANQHNVNAQYELEELQQRMAAQEAELNMLRAMQAPKGPKELEGITEPLRKALEEANCPAQVTPGTPEAFSLTDVTSQLEEANCPERVAQSRQELADGKYSGIEALEETSQLEEALEASLSAEGIVEGLGTPEVPEGSEVSLEILEEAESLSTEELEAFDEGASRDPKEPADTKNEQ